MKLRTPLTALAACLGLITVGLWTSARTQTTVRPGSGPRPPAPSWRTVLERELPRLGHRNWIVIADSAYPAQSRAGIHTVVAETDQLLAVQTVLDLLAKTKHVRPTVYLDAELPHVPEKDAPGITGYRESLAKLLGDRPVRSLPHEQIIHKLDKAAEKFNVLIIKTNLTLPYTSVFLELGCGYWDDEAEKRLRQEIDKGKKEQ
jgi:hypothetical protein